MALPRIDHVTDVMSVILRKKNLRVSGYGRHERDDVNWPALRAPGTARCPPPGEACPCGVLGIVTTGTVGKVMKTAIVAGGLWKRVTGHVMDRSFHKTGQD